MSKNSHKTQLIIAIIGVIGALGAAVIANWDKIFPQRSATYALPGSQDRPSSQKPQGQQGPASPGTSLCFEQYFSALPKDRVAILEAGAKDYQLIGPHQSKDQAIGIRLEENRLPIGALKFDFYLKNTIFKVQSVVDSSCQPVEDYVNASRGGDKHILQNWDDLQVRVGNKAYTLALKYGSGRIDADFIRIATER